MTNEILRERLDAGSPRVWFDEGEVAPAKSRRRLSLCSTSKMLMLFLAFVAAGATSVHANYTWTNVTTGIWTDPANWQDGAVGNGAGCMVDIVPSPETEPMDSRMTQIPDEGVTVGTLRYLNVHPLGANRIWGGPITLDNSDAPAVITGTDDPGSLILLAPLYGATDVQFSNATLASPAHYTGDTYVPRFLSVYGLCYAEAICGTVTNQLPPTRLFLADSATVQCYSHASWEAFDADFTLVEGSRLAICGEPLYQKGLGTAVTGEGVPEGAFFKASINDKTFELNAPATKTGTFHLHVDGLAPWQTSIQRFEEVNVTGRTHINLMEIQSSHCRWEVGKLSGTGILDKNGPGVLAAGIGADFTGALSVGSGLLTLSACDGTPPAIASLSANNATLELAAGLTLTVNALNIEGNLVKTGEGTLAVNAVGGANESRSLDVREGRVVLGASESVRTRCPVTNIWFHVDASDRTSLTLVEENGTNFVTRWNDTDGGMVSATAGTRPFLNTNAIPGKTVVDFGTYNYPNEHVSGYGASMTWSAEDTGIREVFLVFSDTEDVAAFDSPAPSFFLGDVNDGIDFHRGLRRELFIDPYSSGNIRGGLIEVDGIQREHTFALPGGFHLVHLRTTGNVRANAFANDRNLATGGQRLAEVLIFNRTLTDEETTRVNDYLNGKWFVGPGVYAMKNLTVSDDATLTVDSGDVLAVENLTISGNVVKRGQGTLCVDTLEKLGDARLIVEEGTLGVNTNGTLHLDTVDVADGTGFEARAGGTFSVGAVTGAGTFVKNGAGTVTVGALSAGITGIDVRAGSFQMPGGSIPGNAWFHADASCPESLTTVEENGTNFVTRWNDADGGQIFATAGTRPFLNTNAIPGRTVVDFGTYNYPNEHVSGYGASMTWSAEDTGIREVFLVFSDTEDVAAFDSPAPSFFLGDVNDGIDFHRGLGRELFIAPYSSGNIRGGLIEVDGIQREHTFALPGGFHLVHLRTTGNVRANAFANDRNLATGGQRLAEVIIYNYPLTDDDALGVQRHLFSKWWGTGASGARAYEDISVGTGADLNLENTEVTVGTLACAGTLTATTLAPSALELVSDGTAVSAFTLNGVFMFSARGTVNVSGAPLPDEPGRYLVADAQGCEGSGNLSGWIVGGEGVPANRTARLVWFEGQLLLNVSPSGSHIYLR